ncbi:hypothetical protein SUGI_0230990 [Cryptomeria japonica]|nr:hypothetical protein SUGI_0230990 [Cryptomeria japonica]
MTWTLKSRGGVATWQSRQRGDYLCRGLLWRGRACLLPFPSRSRESCDPALISHLRLLAASVLFLRFPGLNLWKKGGGVGGVGGLKYRSGGGVWKRDGRGSGIFWSLFCTFRIQAPEDRICRKG